MQVRDLHTRRPLINFICLTKKLGEKHQSCIAYVTEYEKKNLCTAKRLACVHVISKNLGAISKV